ncbi:hypothetical protein KU06112801_410015 [Flavobacterium psychrophilum]|nr:hypothetical protein KU06062604_290017 [Flavobacterium psychrophilum]SNB14793.1 hypothetical protein KU06112801_410015 [Flavobacterium psychrophilum]
MSKIHKKIDQKILAYFINLNGITRFFFFLTYNILISHHYLC